MFPKYGLEILKRRRDCFSLSSTHMKWSIAFISIICVVQIILLKEAHDREVYCRGCKSSVVIRNAYADGEHKNKTGVPPSKRFKGKLSLMDGHSTLSAMSIGEAGGTVVNVQNASLDDWYFRRQTRKINKHTYTYLLNETPPCTDGTLLLIYIFSLPKSEERRQVIRETYGSIANTADSRIRLVFILGNTGDDNDLLQLKRENLIHRDIVQEDFIDSYANLTLKSVAGLKWSALFCSNVKFVLKTDDDMFINTIKLVNEMMMRTSSELLIGAYNGDAMAVRHGRWRLTDEQYPFDKLPPYLAGAAYLMSIDVVSKLFYTSEYVKSVPLEDVYTTGIVARIAGVTPRSHPGFGFWINIFKSPCDFLQSGLLTSHAMSPANMRITWQTILNKTECR